MSNIAELFVRVTGDTSDITSKMRGAGRSMDDFGNSVNRASTATEGHRLNLGRVERALASYVGHAAGANAVTESLSVAFGSFAVGGGVVAGVLIGVGAIVALYEHFTSAAHEAEKAQNALIKSFEDAQKVKGFAGGVAGQTVEALNARIAAANKKIATLSSITPNTATDQTVAGSFIGQAITKKMTADQRQALENANKDLSAATAERDAILQQASTSTDKTYVSDLATLIAHNTATAAQLRTGTALIEAYQQTLSKLSSTDVAGRAAVQGQIDQLQSAFKTANPDNPFNKFNALREAAAKVNAEQDKEGHDFWKAYIDSTVKALSVTQQLANAVQDAQPSVLEAIATLSQTGQTAGKIDIPSGNLLDVGLTKEQIKTRDALIGADDKNTQILKSTLESLGSIIVSSLNFGGGGRGSSIGTALGGAIGMGFGTSLSTGTGALVGSVLGSFAPGVGTVIGSIAGSLLGGLFDHKKAVNSNTAALNRLTSTLLNAPSGFKVSYYDNQAADAKQLAKLARTQRQVSSRGGATGFALAGG